MTSKKIEASDELRSSLLKHLGNNAAKNKQSSATNPENNKLEEDKVNINVSRSIHNELDPQLLASERREKIDRLKQLIQSGEYKPSSQEVAAALNQEIVFEILSKPDTAANE